MCHTKAPPLFPAGMHGSMPNSPAGAGHRAASPNSWSARWAWVNGGSWHQPSSAWPKQAGIFFCWRRPTFLTPLPWRRWAFPPNNSWSCVPAMPQTASGPWSKACAATGSAPWWPGSMPPPSQRPCVVFSSQPARPRGRSSCFGPLKPKNSPRPRPCGWPCCPVITRAWPFNCSSVGAPCRPSPSW